MTININQITEKLFNEAKTEVIRTRVAETYLLTPDPGKAIKNITTGIIYKNMVSIGSAENLKFYEEVDALTK